MSSTSSSSSSSTFLLGTRASQLAMWQANHLQALLMERYPDKTFQVVPMTTAGDKDQIKPLSDFASKGVFTKELDVATLNNTIQLAIHCMKDLPTTLPAGLCLGAVLPRGDTEDAFVLPESHPKQAHGSLEDLPAGSIIGTSAMRRTATIAKYHPTLKCENIRGNVNTRLAKLDRGDYSALILARIGLIRLGLAHRITQALDEKKFGYAVGQGALAVVCREDDALTLSLLAPLDDLATRWSCEAERGVLRTLQGGCKVPIAIRTNIVLSMDGRVEVDASHTATLDASDASGCGPAIALREARVLGEELGKMLLAKGADKLLEGIIEREGTGVETQ